ncbi:DNRLRE domain-containing protein [Streptosporangium sp. G11]|uniref:DNRLRE domain-containing protein n=1 Tax=Streptosporangium sp. G11 TaxID=3436926 RepID=UPI003EBC794F
MATAFVLAATLSLVDVDTVTAEPKPSGVLSDLRATVAAAKKNGSQLEVVSARREDSTLYAMPDGSFAVEMYTGPVRVKRGQDYVSIDTDLVAENGRLKPKVAKYETTLSAGGPGPLVVFDDGAASRTVGWSRPLPRPVISGNQATYRNAVPGGDLVVAATPTGFTQTVVLRERPSAALEISIPVELPQGQKYRKGAGGRLDLVASNGQTLATAVPLRLGDAESLDSPDAGSTSAVPVEVRETGAGSTLVLRPDQKFLTDTEVSYPVTLSVSDWVGAGLQVDTMISSDYPNSSATSTWLHAGKFGSGSKTARSYIRFNAGLPLRGATIQNADLRLWNYKSNACGSSVGSGIQVRRITSSWVPSTLTMSNQPSTTTTGAIVERSAAGEPDCAEAELYYSVENIVQAWADGADDYGFQLRAANESDATNWRMYRSAESGGIGPVLFIQFTHPGPEHVEFTTYQGGPSVPLDGTPYEFHSLLNVPGMREEDLSELAQTGQVTREPVLAEAATEWPLTGDWEASPKYDELQYGEPAEPTSPTPTPTPTPGETVTLPLQVDTWIDDLGSSGPNGPTLWAGKYDAEDFSTIERTYLKFDTAGLAGKTITNARLELWNKASYGCGGSIKAQRVTSTWNAATLEWDGQPAATAAGESSATETGACPAEPALWSWQLTDIAQAWASGQPNHGVLLRAADESATAAMYDRGFEASEGAHPPVLKVTLADGSGSSPTPSPTSGDTTPPTVVTVNPPEGATGVPANSPVTVTFSEPVTETQIDVYDIQFEEEVPGSVSMNAARTVLTFTPSEPWMDSFMFVTVSEAEDAAGNTMTPYEWTFGEYWASAQGAGRAGAKAAAPTVKRAWARPDGRTLMVQLDEKLRRTSSVTVEVRTAAKDDSPLLWSGVVNDVAADKVAHLQIPSGKVTGKQVHWRARATTGGVAGAWSTWRSATVAENNVTVKAAAAAEPPGSFNLLTSWQSKDNKKINYRQGYWVSTPTGEKGFGHIKIVNKHNLTSLSAHQMTKHPHRGIARDPERPTRYHYMATAYEHDCDGFLWWKECHVEDTQDARTIVEFNTEPNKYQGTLGVLTAYCDGLTRCPWWMDAEFGRPVLPMP